MQNIKYLEQWLVYSTKKANGLFRFQYLRALFPEMTDNSFKTLLSRAVNKSLLYRVCRGVYAFELEDTGRVLFQIVNILRPEHFNYISLETVLSDVGAISQIPINWITIMSSGRSSVIDCGKFGTVEFIHTQKSPSVLYQDITYDDRYGLWRANIKLAIKDMQDTKRNKDLIDWEVVNEYI